MERYQFDRIVSRMEKSYGRLKNNDMEPYAVIFLAMESNCLKVHRAYPSSNSYRMVEAISLCLFDIEEILSCKTYDHDEFRNKDNARLEYALRMAFDPFTNEDVRRIVKDSYGDDLGRYYRVPIQCLIRLRKSVDLWNSQRGIDGYFKYIEEFMGDKIENNQEMTHSVMLPVE